jgi:hypothetical protein
MLAKSLIYKQIIFSTTGLCLAREMQDVRWANIVVLGTWGRRI